MIDLKDIKTKPGMHEKELVGVVREIYPKYDKTLHSKCKQGHLYGIRLREDAMSAVCAKVGLPVETLQKPRRIDRRTLPCRITCRLSKDERSQLQLILDAIGYSTQQEWLRPYVKRFIKRMLPKLKKQGLLDLTKGA